MAEEKKDIKTVDNKLDIVEEEIEKYEVPEYVNKIIELLEENDNSFIVSEENPALQPLYDIFKKFGIKEPAHQTLFLLLCYEIYKQESLIDLKEFVDIVLKWGSRGNAKSVKNFPITEITVENTLQNLFAILKEKYLYIEANGEKGEKLIGLANERKEEDLQANALYQKLAKPLREEWEKAKLDEKAPFPTTYTLRKIIPNDFLKYCNQLGINDNVTDERLEKINKSKRFIQIKYKADLDDYIIGLAEHYKQVLPIVFFKMKEYFTKIIEERNLAHRSNVLLKLNAKLRNTFPTEKISLEVLMEKREDPEKMWSIKSPNIVYWLHILKELNEEILVSSNIRELETYSILQASNLLEQYLTFNRNKQLEEVKRAKVKEAIYKLIIESKVLSKSAIKQIYHKNLITQKEIDDPQLLETNFLIFLNEFLSEWDLAKNQENFITSITLKNEKGGFEDYYIHSSVIFSYFREILQKAKDPVSGVKAVAFVNKIKSIFFNEDWDKNLYEALSNDVKFSEYLLTYVIKNYTEIYEIYRLILNNIPIYKYLMTLQGEKIEFYFNPDGTLKTIDQFLEISRVELLDMINNIDKGFNRIVNIILNMLPFLRKKYKNKFKLLSLANESRYRSKNEKEYSSKLKKTGKSAGTTIQMESGSVKAKEISSEEMALKKKQMEDKIKQFKADLLKMEKLKDEKTFLEEQLKGFSFTPEEDAKIITNLLKEKAKNANITRLQTIQKKFDTISNIDEFLNLCNDLTNDIIIRTNKKHIRGDSLRLYIAMRILQML